MSFQRMRQITTREDGSILYEIELGGFQTFVYMPVNEVQSNLINYGFTAPTFLIFPDKRNTAQGLIAGAEGLGLVELARRNGTSLIFVNPRGESWTGEEGGAYEAVTLNLGIAQSNFRDGLAVMKDNAFPDQVAYNILGSCVRLYVYAFGTGADYVSTRYLRPVEGKTMLGDLGSADTTMVCCTLVGGTVLPTPQKNDIHVVSVGNAPEYNDALKAACGQVIVAESTDLAGDFDRVVGNYRRWAGKVVPAYNYPAEGIIDKPQSVVLPISEDNLFFRRGAFPWGPKEHKVGYVSFYDKDLDVKNGKVPLVLVFHGGGDSAYATASLAEWPEIGQAEGFLTVAVEMHMTVSAKEVGALIDHLMTEYSIDPERIYATGFSMGGIKSWDLFEQIPRRFAALMPMDAIDHVGNNCFFGRTEGVNQDTLVPLFYIGGVTSPLVELPCHEARGVERLTWVSKVNRFRRPYRVEFAHKDNWADPAFGVKGDRVEVLHDPAYPDSEYTVHYFDSEDGECYTALMAVSNHGHEIRPFTNRFAWSFVKRFRRTGDGVRIVED